MTKRSKPVSLTPQEIKALSALLKKEKKKEKKKTDKDY